MPTGYTAAVYDGTETEFRKFAARCAYAFGALVMFRDSGARDELPDTTGGDLKFYEDQHRSAETRLAELKAMTLEDAEVAAANDHREAVRAHEASNMKRQQVVDRHDAMIAKVNRWEPPTPEHAGMKEFMLNQLAISSQYERGTPTLPPVAESGAEWLSLRLSSSEENLRYAAEALRGERERVAGREAWLSALRDSLNSFQEDV